MTLFDQDLGDQLSEQLGSAASAGVTTAIGEYSPIAGLAAESALQMRVSGHSLEELAFVMPLKVILGGSLAGGPSETDLIRAALEKLQRQMRSLAESVDGLQRQLDGLRDDVLHLVDEVREDDLLKELAEAQRLFDSHWDEVAAAAAGNDRAAARRAARRILDSGIDQGIVQIHDALLGRSMPGIGQYKGLLEVWTAAFLREASERTPEGARRPFSEVERSRAKLRADLADYYTALESKLAQVLVLQARGIRLFLDANDAMLGDDERAKDPGRLLADTIAPMIERQVTAFVGAVERIGLQVFEIGGSIRREPEVSPEVGTTWARLDLFAAGVLARVWGQASVYDFERDAGDDALRAFLGSRLGLVELGSIHQNGDAVRFERSDVVLERRGDTAHLRLGGTELARFEVEDGRMQGSLPRFGARGRLLFPGTFWKRYRDGRSELALAAVRDGADGPALPGSLRFESVPSRSYHVLPARQYETILMGRFTPFAELPTSTPAGASPIALEQLDGTPLVGVEAQIVRAKEPVAYGSFRLLRPGPSGMSA